MPSIAGATPILINAEDIVSLPSDRRTQPTRRMSVTLLMIFGAGLGGGGATEAAIAPPAIRRRAAEEFLAAFNKSFLERAMAAPEADFKAGLAPNWAHSVLDAEFRRSPWWKYFPWPPKGATAPGRGE